MNKMLFAAILLAPLAALGCVSGSPEGSRPPDAAEDARLVCVGHVDVEAGVIALRPARSGRIVEVAVRDSQQVHAGDVLVRLDDEAAQISVRQAEANLKAAQLRLAEARRTPAELKHDLDLQKSLVGVAQSRLAAARHGLARKQELRQRNLLDENELKIAEDAVHEAEGTVAAEQQKLARMELRDPQTQVAQAGVEVEAKQALLDEARQALKECTLRASAEGEVLRVLVGAGEMLTSQTALLFSPRQPRIVRAEVPQEFAATVAVGQTARLEDDSQPGQTWKGKVVRVSNWFTQRRSVLQEPQQRNDVRTLECIIQPEPDDKPLRIGQRMRVILAKD